MKVFVGHRGEVTEIRLPDEFELADRFANAIAALNLHLKDGDRPQWVKSDDAALNTLIEAHYTKDYE
jgi:hypothetical protein